MKLAKDFYNKLAYKIRIIYFPTLNNKSYQKAIYAIECFSNGVLGYNELIANLSINCKDTQTNIHFLVRTFVESFEGFEPNILIEYHRPPTKSELRFGYGATHYRDFPIETVLKNDSFGLKRFKNWFISKDDNLRYYR